MKIVIQRIRPWGQLYKVHDTKFTHLNCTGLSRSKPCHSTPWTRLRFEPSTSPTCENPMFTTYRTFLCSKRPFRLLPSKLMKAPSSWGITMKYLYYWWGLSWWRVPYWNGVPLHGVPSRGAPPHEDHLYSVYFLTSTNERIVNLLQYERTKVKNKEYYWE
jgi:hypothetical protein